MDGLLAGLRNKWMVVWIDGLTNGWMDGLTNEQNGLQMDVNE